MLTGLEEGIFPSMHSYQRADGIEEERRLLYVGITRARERLLLTHVRYRSTFGSTNDQSPSRFISEIPEKLALRTDASFWHELQIKQFFTEWLGLKAAPSTVRTFSAISTEPKIVTQKESAKVSKPVVTFADEQKAVSFKAPFKVHQPIKHAKFGIGVIKSVEARSAEDIIITAQFKTGLKKIKSAFISAL
jgi:DNA helicase-2/ATP-dependent DNA helicase PcrA